MCEGDLFAEDVLLDDAQLSTCEKDDENFNVPSTTMEMDMKTVHADQTTCRHNSPTTRNLLTCSMLSGHLDQLTFVTPFFGCYWRNRNDNICGFPYMRVAPFATPQSTAPSCLKNEQNYHHHSRRFQSQYFDSHCRIVGLVMHVFNLGTKPCNRLHQSISTLGNSFNIRAGFAGVFKGFSQS